LLNVLKGFANPAAYKTETQAKILLTNPLNLGTAEQGSP